MKLANDIRLSPFERSDKPNLLLYMNDPVLYANTLRVPHPYTASDADNWLDLMEKEYDHYGKTINWAIRSAEHGVIGGIGAFLNGGPDSHKDEIGYWLAEPFRGQGVMTAVVQNFCKYLYDSRPALVRIEAGAFEHNPASVRVLEKAGFEKEGFAKKFHIKNGTYLDSIRMAGFRQPQHLL